MSDAEDPILRAERLEKEKEQLEQDFGLKRAKFMELFKQKEDELKAVEDSFKKFQEEKNLLQSSFDNVKTELDGIKTATAIAETSREDEMVAMRRQYAEEAASMQHIIKEAVNQAQQSITEKYQQEVYHLQKSNESLYNDLQEAQKKLSQEREGVLDSIAKTLQLKVGKPLGSTSSVKDENLEESMKRAQEDTEILKSVVLPLEEEITSLKEQLHIANTRLREQVINAAIEAAGDHEGASDDTDDGKVKELSQNLETEKSSRSDLEMYVAVLNAQKNEIQKEAENLKSQLQEVMKLLEIEKREHKDLRNTWHVNTDQFLESQRLMMMDMHNMESLLSQEQQRQLEELKKADAEKGEQERKIQEIEEKRQKSEEEAMVSVEIENSDSSYDKSKGSLTSLVSEDFLKFDGDDSTIMPRSQSNQSLSMRDQNFIDSGVHDTKSLNEETTTDIIDGNIPILTEAQHKAIAASAQELKVNDSVLAAVKAKTEGFSMHGKKLVSHHEWSMMQKELKSYRDRIGKPCDMCKNYEAQLQQVQSKEKEAQAQSRVSDRQLEMERSTIKTMSAYTEELETSLKQCSLDAQAKISDLNSEIEASQNNIDRIKEKFVENTADLQDEICKLTHGREEIHKELRRLEKENGELIGKHSKHSQQLQEETINLPENLEDMQLLLLTYREDVIAAKVAKEHMEETLRSEIMFLKSQIVAEQQEKTKVEEELTNEISQLQEELAILQSVKSELDRQTKLKNENEVKMKEAEASLKNIQAKSKQLIGALQTQVEEHSTARTKLEGQVHELKMKIQGLTVDLDNSEAVQRDFVKLSQSLQIQLEKIRAAEHEVRWQHEEDADDCTNCKKTFEVLRRKHHCRHCGKVFCIDCLTKSVPSGPKARQSKVCDVCHTILVRDATPYFSTEPPQTPD